MTEHSKVAVYHILLEGHLDPHRSEWLEGMTIIPLESGETLLAGPVADQAALHGLLAKVRDINLTLISVSRVSPLESRDPSGNACSIRLPGFTERLRQ